MQKTAVRRRGRLQADDNVRSEIAVEIVMRGRRAPAWLVTVVMEHGVGGEVEGLVPRRLGATAARLEALVGIAPSAPPVHHVERGSQWPSYLVT